MINNSAQAYLLNADPDAPARVLREVVAILTQLPSVRRIAVFGSLAEHRADGWSDADLLVACDDVENAKWAAAEAIRTAKPVLFYRSFSTAAQPNGRYWFAGESPFHKIDISFDPVKEYSALLSGKSRLGHPITAREVYVARDSREASGLSVRACPLVTSEREQEIGNYIYQSLRSMKCCLRGGEEFDEHAKGFDGLRASLDELPRDAVMAGGEIGELTHTVGELIEHLGLMRL